jgi:hypothetical protein
MRWVKFKLEIIAHFYQRFSRASIIGKPVDALVVTATSVRTEYGDRPTAWSTCSTTSRRTCETSLAGSPTPESRLESYTPSLTRR